MNPVQRPMFALGLRLLAMFLLQAMMMLVKLGGVHGIALVETMFWRQAIPTALILLWLAGRGQLRRLRTTRLAAHARRSVMGLTGMFLTLGAVRSLPLSEATVLGFTAPIFATVLAVVFLRERVGWYRATAVALGHRVHEAPQPWVLAEHEDVDGSALTGQHVDLGDRRAHGRR